MTPDWVKDSVFYHIYPLGLCDAPQRNDFQSAPVARLDLLYDWLNHMQWLGVNAVYIGPLFESTKHGYDTADYFTVDRRLGGNDSLKALIDAMKQRGFRVIFDAVFNHVGRDFWAFRDLQQHGEQSAYRDWFANVDFNGTSPKGDSFSYEGWAGHFDLVKLNLEHPDVRQHIFDAISFWMDYFGIDGLRLDAADVMSPDFFRALRSHCRKRSGDFWLMGEVVHGDYRQWANADMLDATTNYECYKGLYSSHVDANYYEIGYSLNRQFGNEGIYRDLLLYNFADNHDVNRVASSLKNPAHLYTLYGLLFTMPGVPSIYYGSEWGLPGERTDYSDLMLRPPSPLHGDEFPHPDLLNTIHRLAGIRHNTNALKVGDYRELYIAHEQLAFQRANGKQSVIVVLNAAAEETTVPLQTVPGKQLTDLLNNGEAFDVDDGQVSVEVPANWLRILSVE